MGKQNESVSPSSLKSDGFSRREVVLALNFVVFQSHRARGCSLRFHQSELSRGAAAPLPELISGYSRPQ